MPDFTRLLVWSADYRRTAAARYAGRLAAATGAAITLTDVLQEMPRLARRVLPRGWNLRALARSQKEADLERTATRVRRLGVAPKVALLDGSPVNALVAEVLRGRHDLLVLDAPSADSVQPDRTTATRIVRECPCAVLFVHDGPRRRPRVLVAVDAGPWRGRATDVLNAELLKTGLWFSDVLGGELHVLHAWEAYGERIMRRGGLTPTELKQYVADAREEVREDLERTVAPFDEHVDPAHVHLERGDPRKAIVAFATRHRIDLIVIGTVPRRGLAARVIGDTAETVLDKAPCSVLVIESPREKRSTRNRR
jgi:nucleotide-binding universal stress UspA family protein